MQRGEVWWVQFDERRLVVLLSGEDASGIRVMQVVAPAGVDISGLGIEVTVGAAEGLPFEGVLRLPLPRPVSVIAGASTTRGTRGSAGLAGEGGARFRCARNRPTLGPRLG